VSDWKEDIITSYLALVHEKGLLEEGMAKDPQITELKSKIQVLKQEVEER